MFKNRLPTRIKNHSKESFSYKVFSRSIPDHWIIRDLSERDYGIDVLIEYVTDDNEVTGKLAAIQLKSTKEISFNNNNEWRFHNVKATTTDYWLNSNIPSFIFFISEEEKVYFLSINDYVKRNYRRYLENDNFYYVITPDDCFNVKTFIDKYESVNTANVREMIIVNISYLYNDFYNFFMFNYQRDPLMIIDTDNERMNRINSLCYRLEILSKAVSIKWCVSPLDTIADENYYNDELYEFHLTIFLDQLDKQMQSIIFGIHSEILPHIYFWLEKDPYFVKFVLEYKNELLKDIRWKSIQEGRNIPIKREF